MSDSEVRRLPAALDAPLARVRDAREEIAKAWIVRLLERASLEEIARLPTDRIARELPGLVAELLDAVAGPSGDDDLSAERAGRVARLRSDGTVAPSELARDIGLLQSVLITAFREELQHAEPHVFAEAIERLAALFAQIQAGAVETIVGERQRELEELANTDPLTGLFNVRWLRQELERLLEGHRRYGHPFSLLVLDVDGLKRVNDSLGHAAGDRALQDAAAAIRASLRAVDSAARIGGDEFCVVAPHQVAEQAVPLAERIAAAVEGVAPGGVPIGISIGVVSCPAHALDAEALLETADEAMYRAKAEGRPVAVGEPVGPPTRSARS